MMLTGLTNKPTFTDGIHVRMMLCYIYWSNAIIVIMAMSFVAIITMHYFLSNHSTCVINVCNQNKLLLCKHNPELQGRTQVMG